MRPDCAQGPLSQSARGRPGQFTILVDVNLFLRVVLTRKLHFLEYSFGLLISHIASVLPVGFVRRVRVARRPQ